MPVVYHDSSAFGCQCYFGSRGGRRGGEQMAHAAPLVLQLLAGLKPEARGEGGGGACKLRPRGGAVPVMKTAAGWSPVKAKFGGPPHLARFGRVRRGLAADTATSLPTGFWFNATVPGMCCLPQRTNASNTSPRARPFGVSV